jgi:hypothetical protein
MSRKKDELIADLKRAILDHMVNDRERSKQADAEIAALRAECDQWREELRIYRETESADTARLDWFRTLTPHKLSRIRAQFMPEKSGDIRAAIDAARGEGGGNG